LLPGVTRFKNFSNAFFGADVGTGAAVAGAFVVVAAGAFVGAFVVLVVGGLRAGAEVAGALVLGDLVEVLEGALVDVGVDGELGAFEVLEGAEVAGAFEVSSEGTPLIHWHLSPFVGSE